MTRYLLSSDIDLFLLSERISQDPLENYFGQLRARGGRNENPNIQQCLHNAAAIRIQKSMATDPVRGNCSNYLMIAIHQKSQIHLCPNERNQNKHNS